MKKLLIISFLLSSIGFCYDYRLYSPNNYKGEYFDNVNKILFIVDFSNSMNEKLGNKKKSEIVFLTISNLLKFIDANTFVGLRVYGHKTGITQMQACRASELVVPIEKSNVNSIKNELRLLNARGSTPITYSLKQAIEKDFIGIKGEKRIILLTDGGENCDESPCTYAMNIIKIRDDIKIDVIAINIFDDADSQLKCTALVTKGQFYKANNRAQLLDSLKKSLNIKKNVQATIISK